LGGNVNTSASDAPERQILPAVRELLASARTASLATLGPEGAPHAANVQFAADDKLDLYFISSPHSQHARDMALNAVVALTVYDPRDVDPRGLRGLQIRGRCEVVAAAAREPAEALYLAKFSYLRQHPQLLTLVRSQQVFRLRACWVRYIDNSRGFGFFREFTPPL
jgi:uncharacterized protein